MYLVETFFPLFLVALFYCPPLVTQAGQFSSWYHHPQAGQFTLAQCAKQVSSPRRCRPTAVGFTPTSAPALASTSSCPPSTTRATSTSELRLLVT